MAYTFDYDYISSLTAYLNGDTLSEQEKETLTQLADILHDEVKAGFPEPDYEEEYDGED
jgi:hypothetical protein